MKKKLTTALLLCAMIVSAFASCAQSDNSGAQDTTAADTSAAETTVAETQPEYVKPDVNYDGREFSFAAWATDKPNWIATSYCEVGAEEQNGDIINDAIYTRNATVEEAFGIKMVPKGFDSSSVLINSAMAGDHYTDAALLSGGSSRNLVNNDLAIDLFEIDTLELDKSWWHQQAIESLTIGGHLYFAPGNIGSFDNLSVFSVFVNKNMLEDFNLESPYKAVREGTWTMDMMYEMASVVASDIDGDGTMGEADRFGMSSEGLGDVVLRSTGERLTTKDEDDMPVFSMNTERAASVIEKVVPRWRDKAVTLYTGDFTSKYGHVFSQFLVPMFKSDQLLFVNNWLCIALEMRSMDSDFGILPPPKFDEVQENYYVPSSESWTAYAAVPVTNPDLEFTGDIMNALGYYGREFVQTALIDTTITNKTLRDTDTEEMLQIIFDNRVFDLGAVYDWNKITTTLNQFISMNNTAFASKMASVESAVLSEMEKTIDSLS